MSKLSKKDFDRSCPRYTDCAGVTKNSREILLRALSNFNKLFKESGSELAVECLRNLQSMLKLINVENCPVQFKNTDLDTILKLSRDIDSCYYNKFTIDVYTMVFKNLNSNFKKSVVTKPDFNRKMMQYVKKTKIYVSSSTIFEKNYLTYATSQFVSGNSIDPTFIYPYQMNSIGLGANFESYFCYLYYLMNNVLNTISDLIRKPANFSNVQYFFKSFSQLMDRYVFIRENTLVYSRSKDSEIAPGIYGTHNMSVAEAKIVINLIVVFVSELQAIFFDQVCNNIYLYNVTCPDYRSNLDKTSDYKALARFENITDENSVLNRLNDGIGVQRYILINSYGQRIKPELLISSPILTSDREKFDQSVRTLLRYDNSIQRYINLTAIFLNLVGFQADGSARRCFQTQNDIQKFFKDSYESKTGRNI